MDEKQITVKLVEEKETETGERFEEPRYIIPPHPEVTAPLSKETTNPEEPVTAKDSLPDLIQQAVDDLHIELRAEMETQIRSLQTDLQVELQSELQKERGELEANDKN